MKKIKINRLAYYIFAGIAIAGCAATEKNEQPDHTFSTLKSESAMDKFNIVEGKNIEIIKEKKGNKKHCIEFHNTKPSGACGINLYFKPPIKMTQNLVFSFEHKETIKNGKGKYFAVSLFGNDGRQFWLSDKFSSAWRKKVAQIKNLKDMKGYPITTETEISRAYFYTRAMNKKTAKARFEICLDNVKFETKRMDGKLTDEKRVSYSRIPMFSWKKQKSEKEKLQYSLDPKFMDNSTVTMDIEHNFHAPDKPLKQGIWHWRHLEQSPLANQWSDIKRVVVPKDGHTFKAPRFPVSKIKSTPHPRLKSIMEKKLKKLSGKQKARLPDQAKHIYKNGVQNHPGSYKKGDSRWPQWIDWYKNVADGITAKTGRNLQCAALAALYTGKPEFVRMAKELALDACKWNPEKGSHMQYGDLQAGALLRGLCWCYDVCYESMTPAERKELKDVIVQRASQFAARLIPLSKYEPEGKNHTWNKGFIMAEAGMLLLGENKDAPKWVEGALQLFTYRFIPSLGYQGESHEGIHYWQYGGEMISGFADLMKLGQIDIYQHPWLKQAAFFPIYCAPPGGYAVSFSDTAQNGLSSHGIKGPASVELVAKLADKTNNPYAFWYAGIISKDSEVEAKPPVDLSQSIHYRHLGWAIFNTSLVDARVGVTVALHSGKSYKGHGHADQNSFIVNAYGDKLAIDGGYYDWSGSPHHKTYTTQTIAHNTVLVNGKGQQMKNADGRMANFFDSPGYGYAVGDCSDSDLYENQLNRFDRQMLFIKPGFLVIHDILGAKRPSEFTWLLHSHQKKPIEIFPKKQAFAIKRKKASLRGCFLTPSNLTMTVDKSYQGLPSKPFSTKPMQRERVDTEWTLEAKTKSKKKNEEFLTAMQICREGKTYSSPSADFKRLETKNATGVKITLNNVMHIVLFRRQDAKGTLTDNGLETDGSVCAVEIKNGKIKRALAISASFMRYKGDLVYKSKKKKNWYYDNILKPAGNAKKVAWLNVNGNKSEMHGYEQHQVNDILRTWWSTFNVSKWGRYEIKPNGWTGKNPLYVRIDNKFLELTDKQKVQISLRLAEGQHLITLTGHGGLEGISLQGYGSLTEEKTIMLPRAFKPPVGSVIIEGEKTADEDSSRSKVQKKVEASAALAHCGWKDGTWAE